jgi:RimJ/RimL family protein N-acetyltransferase
LIQALGKQEVCMSVEIREATVDDAAALCDYAARLFAEELTGLFRRPAPSLEEEREFVSAHTVPANSVLLIAELDGRIVGLAGLRGRVHAQEAHVAHAQLSVAGDRGRGIGTLLLEGLFAWAAIHGVTRIEIEALSTNPGAIRLYERVGFVRDGLRRGAVVVDGAYVDTVCLSRGPVA